MLSYTSLNLSSAEFSGASFANKHHQSNDSFDESVGGFFESHCNRCHDDKKQKGDSDWMNFRTSGEDGELWFEVMDRIIPVKCLRKGSTHWKRNRTSGQLAG